MQTIQEANLNPDDYYNAKYIYDIVILNNKHGNARFSMYAYLNRKVYDGMEIKVSITESKVGGVRGLVLRAFYILMGVSSNVITIRIDRHQI